MSTDTAQLANIAASARVFAEQVPTQLRKIRHYEKLIARNGSRREWAEDCLEHVMVAWYGLQEMKIELWDRLAATMPELAEQMRVISLRQTEPSPDVDWDAAVAECWSITARLEPTIAESLYGRAADPLEGLKGAARDAGAYIIAHPGCSGQNAAKFGAYREHSTFRRHLWPKLKDRGFYRAGTSGPGSEGYFSPASAASM